MLTWSTKYNVDEETLWWTRSGEINDFCRQHQIDAQLRNVAKKAFSQSKTDDMIDTIVDLPQMISEINQRLANGERPS